MTSNLLSKVLALYDRVVHPHASEQAAVMDSAAVDSAAPIAIEPDEPVTTPIDAYDAGAWRTTAPVEIQLGDEGVLYGVHTPGASDTNLPDDDRAFAEGQNWLEALEEASVEGGPLPEHDVDVEDEDDDVHPHTQHDRPIADLGSGGRGGL